MSYWFDDEGKQYEREDGGGFEDSTLLKTLLEKTPNATIANHEVPDLVLIDIMCSLHQISHSSIAQEGLTCAHIYNLVMRPVRQWISLGTQQIVIGTDKGRPHIKAATAAKRKAGSDARQILPYEETVRFHKGCLVEGSVQQSKFIITKVHSVVDLRRILRTSKLRDAMLLFFFEVLLPREQFASTATVYVDYSLNEKQSPRCYSKGIVTVSRAHWNGWLECDWALSWWLNILPHKRALLLSIDGDMLPILALNLKYRSKNYESDLWLYNSGSGPTGRIVDMKRFVADLNKHEMSEDGFAILCHILGNDYVLKKAVTPGLGAKSVFDGVVFALEHAPIELITGPSSSLPAFMSFVRTIYGHLHKGASAPNEDSLGSVYTGFVKGTKVWSDCAQKNAPAYPTEF